MDPLSPLFSLRVAQQVWVLSVFIAVDCDVHHGQIATAYNCQPTKIQNFMIDEAQVRSNQIIDLDTMESYTIGHSAAPHKSC